MARLFLLKSATRALRWLALELGEIVLALGLLAAAWYLTDLADGSPLRVALYLTPLLALVVLWIVRRSRRAGDEHPRDDVPSRLND